jgi:hypothetical protein
MRFVCQRVLILDLFLLALPAVLRLSSHHVENLVAVFHRKTQPGAVPRLSQQLR